MSGNIELRQRYRFPDSGTNISTHAPGTKRGAHPNGDDCRVIQLRRMAVSPDPSFADNKHGCHDDAVADEATPLYA
jgi:hypothetical protein